MGAIFSSVDKAKEFCNENNNCVAIAQSENEFWPVRSTDDFLPCDKGDSCDPQLNYLKREEAKRDVLCMEKDTSWTADKCLRTRRDLMRSPYTFSPYEISKYAYTAEECEEKAEQMKKDGYDIEFTSPIKTFTSNTLPSGCQTVMEGGKKHVQFNTSSTGYGCTFNLCHAGDEPFDRNSQCCTGTLGSFTEAECKKWVDDRDWSQNWQWDGSGNWNDRPYGCIRTTSGNRAYFNKTQTNISCSGPNDWEGYSCIKKCSHGGYTCPAGRFSCLPHDDQTYCIFPKDTRTLCSDGKTCMDWLRRENQRKNNACSFLGHVDEAKITNTRRYEDTSEMAWVCCSRNLVGTCKTYRMGGGECFPDHDTTVDYVLKNKPDMSLNKNRTGWRSATNSTLYQCAVPSYTAASFGKPDETILSTECRRVAKQFNDLEWSGDNNFLSDIRPYGCFHSDGKVYYNKKQDSPMPCSYLHRCFKRKKACTDKIVSRFLKTFYYDIVKTQILNSPAFESQDNQYCINSINMFGNDDPDISCEKICCDGTPCKRFAADNNLTFIETKDLSDNNSGCGGWASANECERNPVYMWVNCKKSCYTKGSPKGCVKRGSKVWTNEHDSARACGYAGVDCIETSRVKSNWPEKAASMKTITKKDACDPELLCCKDILGNPDKQNCPVGIQPDYYNEPSLCPFGHDKCKGEVVEVSTACCKDIFGNMDSNNCPSSCDCVESCTKNFWGDTTCKYQCSDGSCPYGCRIK